MKALIYALSLYPVTYRQVRGIEDLHTLIEAAYAELSNLEAKPYIRLCSQTPGIVVLANICSQSYDVWNETLKGSDFIGPENVEIRCES